MIGNENKLSLCIQHVVRDYKLLLHMRMGTESKIETSITVVDNDTNKGVCMMEIKEDIITGIYTFSNCETLQFFNELIFSIEKDGENGLQDFLEDHLDKVHIPWQGAFSFFTKRRKGELINV